MVRMTCWVVGIALLGAGAVGLRAEQKGSDSLVQVVGQLGSEDFAVRAAAQERLREWDWRDLAALRKVAAEAKDAEVVARVRGRIEEIEDVLAVSPPAIELDLKDA